jgi:AcrR family transcriptional regulator
MGSIAPDMSTRLPAADRRLQLIDVATETFGDVGFHSASMNAIAAAAGVTKPVLYQHFSSKEDLFTAVLRHVGAKLRTALESSVAQAADGRERVELGFAAYFGFLHNHRASARVLFGEARRIDETMAKEANRAVESIANMVADLIEIDGLSTEERRVLANGVVGLAEGAGRAWIRRTNGLSAERLAEVVAELAWAGLRGE